MRRVLVVAVVALVLLGGLMVHPQLMAVHFTIPASVADDGCD